MQVKLMTPAQREAAFLLLRSVVSQLGYKKATTIMSMEKLLHELEGGKGANIRDPERYFFTVFGDPSGTEQWGLSIEGHHMSLNFVLKGDQVVSSTPLSSIPLLVLKRSSSAVVSPLVSAGISPVVRD